MFYLFNELSRSENGLVYPLNQADFEKYINSWGSLSPTSKEFENLYSKLDIFGNAYINLNDIPHFRGTQPLHLSPYIHIPTYIQTLEQKNKQNLPSKYMGAVP